jgi:RNA polymerase sigma-70 factor (sigma-E family)
MTPPPAWALRPSPPAARMVQGGLRVRRNVFGISGVLIVGRRWTPLQGRWWELITFDEFVAVQTRQLLGLAASLTGADWHLSQDLVQDVLLKAYRHWAVIGDLEQPYGYVRRMLVNEYISWRRRWARLIPVAVIDAPEALVPDPAANQADRAALDGELRQLPRRQRTVLVLRYYEGLSDAEIAETLACSISAVRSYASRALSTLRSHPEALLAHDGEV